MGDPNPARKCGAPHWREGFGFDFLMAMLVVTTAGAPVRAYEIDSPYGVVAFIPSPTRWDAMRDATITWGRCGFSWRDIETPTKGTFNWAVTDEAVAAANARGLKIYAGLGYTPVWASSISYPQHRSQDPPSNPQDWYDFVFACVTRYKGSIKHWELWNEPNISGFWNSTMTAYINNIVKIGSDAVHAADPDGLVLAPEISRCCSGNTWMTTVLAQAGDKIDIIAFHQYDYDSPQSRLSAPTLSIDQMHNLIVSAGYNNKPIWVTECGWESDTIGEQVQANDLVAMLAGMPSRPWWKKFFWYQIWEGPTGLAGLLHQDETPKLAWYAHRDYAIAHPPPVMVWVNSNPTDTENGISRVVVGDGDTTSVTQLGHSARRNLDPAQDFYIYYNVADSFAFQGSRPAVAVNVDYYDGGTGSLTLQYDSTQGGIYKNSSSVALAGVNTWKQYTFQLNDAYFGNRQNGGADFRIAGGVGMTYYVDVVQIDAAPLAPKIGLSPLSIDRSVVQGQNLPNDSFNVTNLGDLPLNYTITGGAAWMNPSPTSGSSSGEADPISILYSTTGLAIGTYAAGLSVADPNASNTPQTVNVTVHVRSHSDFDLDGDVDLGDFAHLQLCFGLPGQVPPACTNADLNPDSSIDAGDFNVFLPCMAGPDHTPGC